MKKKYIGLAVLLCIHFYILLSQLIYWMLDYHYGYIFDIYMYTNIKYETVKSMYSQIMFGVYYSLISSVVFLIYIIKNKK